MKPSNMDQIDSSAKIRLLHLDDNEDDRVIAKHHFTRLSESIEIVWAKSAEEARDMIRQGKVDCVISDYQMPVEDGLSFLKSLRMYDVDLPFILFTGHGNEEIASRAFKLGADDYFSKISGSSAYERVLNSAFNLVEAFHHKRDSERLESRFRQLFEENVSGAFQVSLDGAIVEANESFYTMLGFEDEESRESLRMSGLFERPAAWQHFAGMIKLEGSFEKQTVTLVDRKLHTKNVLIQARLSEEGDLIIGTMREAGVQLITDSNGDEHQFSMEHFLNNTAVPTFYFVLDHPISCESPEETKLRSVETALLAECNGAFVDCLSARTKTELMGNDFAALFEEESYADLRRQIVDFARSDEVFRQESAQGGSAPCYTLYSVRREGMCIGFWGTMVLQKQL